MSRLLEEGADRKDAQGAAVYGKDKDPETVYTILDPTGNITALVESPVEIGRQPMTAAALMKKHPEVEQVGFVHFQEQKDERSDQPDQPASPQVFLRMAGGEFCGNASMCAAALFQEGRGRPTTGGRRTSGSDDDIRHNTKAVQELAAWKTARQNSDMHEVAVQVSGTSEPVKVCLQRVGHSCYRAGVTMPPALGIEFRRFKIGKRKGELPLVRMEGICHIIIEEGTVFSGLVQNKATAEKAVRQWCRELSAEGLGLMFTEGIICENVSNIRLTPLVYVSGAGTVFWENSCASGSSAVGMYSAHKSGRAVSLTLKEPGGILRVECGPDSENPRLYGEVKVRARFTSRIE